MSDTVNHPSHYTSHPSGIECIDVVEHMGFNLGNAIKYLWRVDEKGAPIEDLRKAAWYVNREIERREGNGGTVELVEFDPSTGVEREASSEWRKCCKSKRQDFHLLTCPTEAQERC